MRDSGGGPSPGIIPAGAHARVASPPATGATAWTVVPISQIPLVLKQATIATEDPSFYTNAGVDLRGIARAAYYYLRYGKPVAGGGSTITQQLVRNTIITAEPTLDRKIREAMLALEITRRYSKDQILEYYLNAIPYGNLAYGIEAASETYFGKRAEQLDAAAVKSAKAKIEMGEKVKAVLVVRPGLPL